MIEQIKNKKILFFCPKFFGYEKEISQKMIDSGAEVKFYDERMNPSTLEKMLIRLNFRGILKSKINRYYKKIIDEYNFDYFDYVLFFNPETVTIELLKALKEKQKKAKFVLYMWDSFSNKSHSRELMPYFDKSLTFNREDAYQYNMIFRPLFFIDKYDGDCNKIPVDCDIDICFIGTIHSDRYKLLKQVEQWAYKNELKIYFYMYFPSLISYFVYKLRNIGKISVLKKDFKFIPMKSNEVFSYLARSKVIIDIQHPKQTGLTMRTIEILGMRKKLITTNTEVRNYDFYNEDNIEIIDRNNVCINRDFILNEFNNSVDNVRKKYTIESFLGEIVDD